MSNAILPKDLAALRILEAQLKRAQQTGDIREAEEAMKAIQRLLTPYNNHSQASHRDSKKSVGLTV
jgi:hypothetical protein